MTYKQILTAIMEGKGWSQKETAAYLDVTESSISAYLSGVSKGPHFFPTLKTLNVYLSLGLNDSLCRVLDVPASLVDVHGLSQEQIKQLSHEADLLRYQNQKTSTGE